jgi:hypothetical protein
MRTITAMVLGVLLMATLTVPGIGYSQSSLPDNSVRVNGVIQMLSCALGVDLCCRNLDCD